MALALQWDSGDKHNEFWKYSPEIALVVLSLKEEASQDNRLSGIYN